MNRQPKRVQPETATTNRRRHRRAGNATAPRQVATNGNAPMTAEAPAAQPVGASSPEGPSAAMAANGFAPPSPLVERRDQVAPAADGTLDRFPGPARRLAHPGIVGALVATGLTALALSALRIGAASGGMPTTNATVAARGTLVALSLATNSVLVEPGPRTTPLATHQPPTRTPTEVRPPTPSATPPRPTPSAAAVILLPVTPAPPTAELSSPSATPELAQAPADERPEEKDKGHDQPPVEPPAPEPQQPEPPPPQEEPPPPSEQP